MPPVYGGRSERANNLWLGKIRTKRKATQQWVADWDCLLLVGAARFELAAPCTPCRCATGLRHAPTLASIAYQACGPQGGRLRRPPPTSRSSSLTARFPRGEVTGRWRTACTRSISHKEEGPTEQSEEGVVLLPSGHFIVKPFLLHGAHKGENRLVTTTAKVYGLSSAGVFHWGRPSFGSWKAGAKNYNSRLGWVSRGH